MAIELDATLILWGDDLVPDEITAIVGRAPTRAEQRGQKRIYSGDRLVVARTGMWSLSTLGAVSGCILADHLNFILNIFEPNLNILEKNGNINQRRLSVIVTLEKLDKGSSSWEDEIDANLLAAVGKLGASLAMVVSYSDYPLS